MRRASTTFVAAAAVLSLSMPHAAAPCSILAGPASQTRLGLDGLGHWAEPPLRSGERTVSWLTEAGEEPLVEQIAGPATPEGQANLLAVLPDGTAWWWVWCSDWDPPSDPFCSAWVLTDSAGQPIGRLDGFSGDAVGEVLADGTMQRLEVHAPRLPQAPDQPPLLRLWRGAPQSLDDWQPTADRDAWIERLQRRFDRGVTGVTEEPPGWELLWQTPFPLEATGWAQRAATLRGDLLATVLTDRDRVEAAVWRVHVDSGRAELERRWQHRWPLAQEGLAETADGAMAMAQPGRIELGPGGELALGGWAIEADCSSGRPNGFVTFDREGNLLADVRTEHRVEALFFRPDGTIAVGSWDQLHTYDPEGNLLRSARLRSSELERAREERAARAQALDEGSDPASWVELWELADRVLGSRVLAEAWPRVQIPARLWPELAETLCAADPQAAPRELLLHYQSARGELHRELLGALPACFAEPPPGAIEHARELSRLREREKNEIGRRILAHWPRRDHFEELWSDVLVGGGSDASHVERERARIAGRQLLEAFVTSQGSFEERLRGTPEELTAAQTLLLSAPRHVSLEHLGTEGRAAHEALRAAAGRWSGSMHGPTQETGALLRLAHDRVLPGAVASSLIRRSEDDLILRVRFAIALEHALTDANRGGYARELPESIELDDDSIAELVRLFDPTTISTGQWRGLGGGASLGRLGHVMVLLLGDRGRELLWRQLTEGGDALRRRAALPELARWMAEEPASWPEARIRRVVDELVAMPAGLRADDAPLLGLLGALGKEFGDEHPLHRMARRRFDELVDGQIDAVADGNAPTSLPLLTRLAQYSDLRATPLADWLTLDQVDALLPDPLAAHDLEQALTVLVRTGPPVRAVPQLERWLTIDRFGPQKVGAAITLSHLGDPAALPVLIEMRTNPFYSPLEVVVAVSRYGHTGLTELLGELESTIAGLLDQARAERSEGPDAAWRWHSLAAAQCAVAVHALARLPVEPPRRGDASLRESAAWLLEDALRRGEWPPLAVVALLEAHGEEALQRVLALSEALPTNERLLWRFLGDDPALYGMLVRRLRAMQDETEDGLGEAGSLLLERLEELGVADA